MNARAALGIARLLVAGALASSLAGCQRESGSRGAGGPGAANAPGGYSGETRFDEVGTNRQGIPRYTHRAFTAAERDLLRAAFGVDEPEWMYVTDSSAAALVKFDTRAKRCATCYVDSYTIGFLSVRPPGETWEVFEARLHGRSPRTFSPAARIVHHSLDALDPDAQPAFARLIDVGRRAGFRLSILETYRSPEREALLFVLGRGRTYTATSMHSYGRAVDIAVDDGRWDRALTRRDWTRFRQFVQAQTWARFRLIGAVDKTWDWPHVELVSPSLGFHSIDAALDFAARCTSDSARAHPPTSAQLGGAAADPCVFVPHLAARR